MKIRQNLLFALTGWVAGLCITLILGLLVFPAVVPGGLPRDARVDLLVLAIVLVLVSPAALVGGLLGGRLPREGGRAGQLVAAGIVGIVLAMPFSCLGLWYLGG